LCKILNYGILDYEISYGTQINGLVIVYKTKSVPSSINCGTQHSPCVARLFKTSVLVFLSAQREKGRSGKMKRSESTTVLGENSQFEP